MLGPTPKYLETYTKVCMGATPKYSVTDLSQTLNSWGQPGTAAEAQTTLAPEKGRGPLGRIGGVLRLFPALARKKEISNAVDTITINMRSRCSRGHNSCLIRLFPDTITTEQVSHCNRGSARPGRVFSTKGEKPGTAPPEKHFPDFDSPKSSLL